MEEREENSAENRLPVRPSMEDGDAQKEKRPAGNMDICEFCSSIPDEIVKIQNITNFAVKSYILKNVFTTQIMPMTCQSVICKEHIGYFNILILAKEKNLINNKQQHGMTANVIYDTMCNFCNTLKHVVTALQLIKDQNLRNFLAKNRGIRGKEKWMNICQVCLSVQRRKCQTGGLYSPNYGNKKKTDSHSKCIVAECKEDCSAHCETKINRSRFSKCFNQDITDEDCEHNQTFCLLHYKQYTRTTDGSLCVVCEKVLRAMPKKKRRIAFPAEKKSIADIMTEHNIPIPQNFLSEKFELCVACIKNPIKNIKQLNDIATVTEQHLMESPKVAEIIIDHPTELDKETKKDKLKKIRKEAIQFTLKILKEKLSISKVAVLSDMVCAYYKTTKQLAEKYQFSSKVSKPKSEWLRTELINENIDQGSGPFELSFFFISKKRSSLIFKTEEDHVKIISSLLHQIPGATNTDSDHDISSTEEDVLHEGEYVRIDQDDNVGANFFNYGKDLNESVLNTIKTIKEKWNGKVHELTEISLEDLIFSIDNNLFNHVTMLTLTTSEFKKIQDMPVDWHDPGWILTFVDFQNVASASYRRLFRRICICYNMAFTLDPSCQTPLHVSLTDYVQKCSGSQQLITMLNQCGFCLNMDTFREFRVKVASHVRENEDFGTPMDITMEQFGFITGDNMDLAFQHSNIRDEGGHAKSMHLLGTMLTFPNPEVRYPMELYEDGKPLKPQKHSTEITHRDVQHNGRKVKQRSLKLEPIVVPEYPRPGPVEKQLSEQMWRQHEINEDVFSISPSCELLLKEVDAKVLTLCCQRLNHKESNCCGVTPSLKVSLKCQGYNSPIATTCYFTMLNSPPDAKKTVKVWLDFFKSSIVSKYGLTKLVVIGDGKTFGIITEIITDYPELYSWVLQYLGEFHRNEVYMRVINKLYDGAGLETLAMATYGGTTLNAVLKVTHYRKALDFLMNAVDAVIIMQIKAFLRYCDEVVPDEVDAITVNKLRENSEKCLLKLTSDEGQQQFNDTLIVVREIMPQFREFLQWASMRSNSFKLWKNFVWDDMAALIYSLEAIASGNWNLNMSSGKLMVPLLFALDAINYKRWAVQDILAKEEYPPEIKQIFQNYGCWRMAVSHKKNAAMAPDMGHECFLNKPMKSAINCHKTNPSLIELETHYLPYRSKLVYNLEKIVSGKEHKDIIDRINPEEAKRQYNEVSKYIVILEKSDIFNDIFYHSCEEPAKLKSLKGLEVSSKVEHCVLNAREIGQKCYDDLVTERLIEKRVGIKERIPKSNLVLFPSILDKQRKKKVKDSTCIEHHRLMKIVEVSTERKVDLKKVGVYMLGDDSALSEERGTKPFLGQSKASVINGYLKVQFQTAFTPTRPFVDCIIVDGENFIFLGILNKGVTFQRQITDLFNDSFKWRFKYCKKLKLSFDQHGFTDDTGEILKGSTKAKRYVSDPKRTHPIIEVSETAVVPDNWECVTHNRENRKNYKTVMGEILISSSVTSLIPTGKELVVNGLYEGGKTFCITKSVEGDVLVKEIKALKYSEADVKMFMLSDPGSSNLIVSLDTDSIFIGLLKQTEHKDTNYYIEMGKVTKEYVDLQKLVQEISSVYSDISTDCAISSMVTLYAATGCDFTPYFRHLTKSNLFLLNETENVSGIKSDEDLSKLLIKAYEKKYPGLRYSTKLHTPSADIPRLRVDLFSRKNNEQATIPLHSIIKLQFCRAQLIKNYWKDGRVSKEFILKSGWEIRKDGEIQIQLIDEDDPYYRFPRTIVKGCACKKECNGGRCSCTKRNLVCHVKTCSCVCFKEDITITTLDGELQTSDPDSEEEEEEREDIQCILETDSD